MSFERAFDELERATCPAEQFLCAYDLARSAALAVVLAATRPRARWQLWQWLGRIAPELREWAEYFAAHDEVAAVAQAGATAMITQRQADDFERGVRKFTRECAKRLGQASA